MPGTGKAIGFLGHTKITIWGRITVVFAPHRMSDIVLGHK